MTELEHGPIPDENLEPVTPPHTFDEVDTETQREKARTTLAIGLVVIFGLTVLGAFVAFLWPGVDSSKAKDLLSLLLPVESALLGSALGFYFGTKSNGS